MFNKLVSNIKGGAKKSDEDEEVSEAVESEKGGDDDEKKKKKSMAIKVVVVLGLAYLAVDSFLFPPGNNEAVVTAPVIKKRKRPKKALDNKDEAKPGETKVVDAKASDPTNPPGKAKDAIPETASAQAPSPSPEQPPVENINIEKGLKDAGAPEGATAPMMPPEPAAEMANTNAPNPEMDKAIGDLSANVNPNATPPSAETPVAPQEATPTPEVATPAVESATASEPAAPAAPAFNEPYAPPPNYEELGRGLVYNCKEAHWSCVNRLAYVACNKNTQWNRGAGKAPECVVQNIFKNDEDCGKMQRYYVANNKETSFCK
jgi:hypothetical protein